MSWSISQNLLKYYTFDTKSVSGTSLPNWATGTGVPDATLFRTSTSVLNSQDSVVGTECLQFTRASQDRVTININNPITPSMNGFSVSFWIKATNLDSTNCGLFSFSSTSTDDIFLNILSTGILQNTTINVCDGSWNHIVATYSTQGQGVYKLYVNNTLVHIAQMTYPGTTPRTACFIGRPYTASANSYYYDGLMDDFRVYDTTLSNIQVQILYMNATRLYYTFEPNTIASTLSNKAITVSNMATGINGYDVTMVINGIGTTTDYKTGTGCLSLSSTSSALIGAPATPTMNISSTGLSFSYWLKPFPSNGAYIFDLSANTVGTNDNIYMYYYDNILRAGYGLGNPNTYLDITANAFTGNGSWIHIALTISSGGIWRIYLNGAFNNMKNIGYPTYNSITRKINDNWKLPGFSGKIDEFRMYQRTISNADVLFLYEYPYYDGLKSGFSSNGIDIMDSVQKNTMSPGTVVTVAGSTLRTGLKYFGYLSSKFSGITGDVPINVLNFDVSGANHSGFVQTINIEPNSYTAITYPVINLFTKTYGFTGVYANAPGTATSLQIKGYFKPNISGIWTFNLFGEQTYNDDYSLLWIGANALNRTFDNALIYNISSLDKKQTTIYLNADTYYPLLLYWANSGGPYSLSLGIKSPTSTQYVYNGIFDSVNCFFNNDDPPASFAGTGTSDDVVTSSSVLNNVQDMVTDSAGNMYIADYSKHIIYKVDATTSIRTVFAGTGLAGYSGDGGSASSAQLNGPYSLTIGPDNNLYVAEFLGDRIRRVVLGNNSVNTISTFAGSSAVARNISSIGNFNDLGYNAGNGLAKTIGIAINQDSTRLIFCRRNDTTSNNFCMSVRANSSSAWSTAFVAISNTQSNDQYIGIAMTADGSRMATIIYYTNLLYISNWTGATTGYVGYGRLIPQPGITSRSYSGLDMTADGSRIVTSTFYVSTDSTKSNGQIYFSNWNGTSYPDFTLIDSTTIRDYAGIGVSRDGSRLVCGAANTGIFWATWNGTTYVNLTQIDFNNYNPYTSASVSSWRTCRFSPDNSIIYISCSRSVSNLCLFYTVYDYVSNNYKGLTIIEPTPTSTYTYASSFDGWPLCISYDGSGSTIFASTYSTNQSTNQKIYQSIVTYNYSPGISGRLARDASLNGPTSIAFDSASNAYIAESTGNRISKVTNSTGQIATYAGYGVSGRGYGGDAGAATSAKINIPMAVEVDSLNNVFFTDSLNSIVRKVDNAGVISTVNGALRVAFSNYNTLFSRASKYASTTGMVINNDRNIMVFCSNNAAFAEGDFYFYTLAANGTWSGPTSFGVTFAAYWNGIGMTGDGSRIVISNSNSNTSFGAIYMYTWTGSTYGNQSILTDNSVSNKIYNGVDITLDGSRLVTCTSQYIYFATWNSTTYTNFTRIDDSNVRGYSFIRVTKDGSRLVCSGDNSIIYWAKWNGSNYANLIPINYTSTIVYNQWRSFTFSADNNVIFANITQGSNATNYTRNRYYFSYDTTLNNYTGPIEINVTAIPTTVPGTSTIHVDGWLLCTDGSGTTLYAGNNSYLPITSTSLTYYNAGTSATTNASSSSANAIALTNSVFFGAVTDIALSGLSDTNMLGNIAIDSTGTTLYCVFNNSSTRGLAYYTKINGIWTGPTNIDNPSPTRTYHFVAVNALGTRIVVLSYSSGIIYLFTFTTSWSTSVQIANISANTSYYGLDMTGDGSRIVTCTTTSGYIYFATWTGSTYSTLTQIADTNARNYYGVSVSRDGTRLVTATNNNATNDLNNGVFWATWNGANYVNLTKINFGNSFPTTIGNWRCCQFSPDNNILFLSTITVNENTPAVSGSNRYYSVFDYNLNNYSGCTLISTDAIPLGARSDGVQMCVSYDGKTLYTGNWHKTGYISPIYATALSYNYYPTNSLAIDSSNNMYVTDTTGQRVSMISGVNGQITTVAGSSIGTGTSIGSGTTTYSTGDGGVASSASLHYATNIKFDANDNLYIADNGTGASVGAGCRLGSSTVVRKMISNAHISSMTSSAYMIKNTSNAFDLFQPNTDFKSGVTTNYKINGNDIANLSNPILQNAMPISGYSIALMNQLPVRDGIMMHLDACMNVVTTNQVTRWTGTGSTGTSTYAYPNDGLFYYYRFEPSDVQSSNSWVANMATGYPVYDAYGFNDTPTTYDVTGSPIVSYENGYTRLIYNSSGSFKPTNYTGKIGYIVVAGGRTGSAGGSSLGAAGAGGAGGEVKSSTWSSSSITVTSTTLYSITIGAANGNSIFGNNIITSNSGGGGAAGAGGVWTGTGTSGVGSPGSPGTNVIISDININTTYGGGGGGGGTNSKVGGTGGNGGGGRGGNAASSGTGGTGTGGTVNTGGGGGGGGSGNTGGAPGAGGSGIVIIYFPTFLPGSAPVAASSSTIFNKNDYVVGSQDLSLNFAYNSLNAQYLKLNTPFVLDTNGLTFSCWFKMSSFTNAWARIFDFGNGQDNNNIIMAITATTQISTQVYNGSSATTLNVNTAFSLIDRWTHVAWTITPKHSTSTITWTIYINGASSTSGVYIYPNIVTNGLSLNYLGKSNWATDPYFNGQIDDFRTYNRCLTASEVTNLYDKTMYNYAPLYKTNFINLYPALDFGAVPSSVLVTPKSSVAIATEATLFFVFQKSAVDITNARASHLLTSYDARSNNGLNIMFSGWNSVPGSLQIEHYTDGTVTGVVGCNFVPQNNTPYILTLRFQASTNTLLLFRVNGVDYGVNGSLGTNVFGPTILFSSSSLTINSSQWVIGNYLPDLTRNFYGGIGEFIHYNTALSNTNIPLVEQYLSNRWSIGIGINPAISTTTTNSVNSITYQFSAMNATLTDVSFVMPVSSWTDTTVGVTARQRINSLRPMYSIKNASTGLYDVSINSLPVINFGANILNPWSSNRLTIDSQSINYIDNTSAICSNVSTNASLSNSLNSTIVIVFQRNEDTLVQSQMICTAKDVTIEISTSNMLGFWLNSSVYTTQTIALNTPYILLVNFTSPDYATATSVSYRLNGSSTVVAGTFAGNYLFKSSTIDTLGYYTVDSSPNNRNLKGVIGEIAYYNRTLSAIEITKVENYLSKKWQIAIGAGTPTISLLSDYGLITPAYQITPLTGQVTTYNGKRYIATASSVASSVSQPFNVFNRGLTFDYNTSTWESGYAGRNGYRQNPYSAVGYYQDPSFNVATTLNSILPSSSIIGLATSNNNTVIVACYPTGLITSTNSGTSWSNITPIKANNNTVTANSIRYITLSSNGQYGAFIMNDIYICWFYGWSSPYTTAPPNTALLGGVTIISPAAWLGLDMTPDQSRIVACSSNGKLVTSIYTNGSFGALTAIIPDIPTGLYFQGIAITFDGKRIAVGSYQSGIVYVFDLLDQATNTDANAYTSIAGGGVVIAPGTPYIIYPGVPITFVPSAPTSSYIRIALNGTYIIPYGTSKILTMNGTSNNYTTQTISTSIYNFRNLRFDRTTPTTTTTPVPGPRLFISTYADNMYYCVYNSTVSRYSDPIQIPDVAVPYSPATIRDTYGLAISYDNKTMYTDNWNSNIIYATNISTIASSKVYSTAYSLLGSSSSPSNSGSTKAIVSGEWIQIQLPYQLKLIQYNMLQNLVVTRNSNSTDINPYNEPTHWCVVGSNDGSNWTLVHSCSDTPMISGTLRSFMPSASSSEFYSYFRLVVNEIWPNTQASDIYHRLSMCQWNLYGVYKYTDSLVPLLTNYGMPQQIVPVPGATFKSNVLKYNNKTYIASASSYSTANVSTYTYFFPYLAFNNVLYNNSMYEGTISLTNKSSNVFWSAAADYGPNYSGDKKTNYFDNTNAATPIAGEWIQMQLSFSVLLTQYSFVQRSNLQIPGKFYILGSNDGITWFLLDFVDNSSLNHANYPTFFNRLYTIAPNTFTNNYYTYFRMVISSVYGSFTNMCSMYQLSLIGIPM